MTHFWVFLLFLQRCHLMMPLFIVLNYFNLGFPGGSDGKELTSNAGDTGSISGLGRSPAGGRGNPLQYSCLDNPHEQRSLRGYSPWGHKESDTTERLSSTAYLNEIRKKHYKSQVV